VNGTRLARKIQGGGEAIRPGAAIMRSTWAFLGGAGDGSRTRTVSLEGRRSGSTRTWWARSTQEVRDRSCPLVTVRGTGYWQVDGMAAPHIRSLGEAVRNGAAL
jgi:hypothetical protein